jgi:hypothetical protein
MRLWKRRTEQPADAVAGTSEARPEPAPVAVFLLDRIVEGWIVPGQRRLSEGLNDGQPLRVQTSVETGEPGTEIDFDLDTVVAVAPPPQSQPSPARVSRRRHQLELRAGPYIINGVAHMPAGADPARYARSMAHRWLPLTRCSVSRDDEEWAVDVVIVNLDHVSRA